MQSSLRKVLIDSHVAAVTIAILIFSALGAALMALLGVFFAILYTLSTEANDWPGFAHLDRDNAIRYIVTPVLSNLSTTLSILVEALACLFTAYLFSRWIYGMGPMRILSSYRNKLSRRTHA